MANVRAPNLTFTGSVNPNRIPVSVAISPLSGPIVVVPSPGTNQRAPNLNFALGVQPNEISVSVPVSQTSGNIIITPSPNTAVAALRLSVFGTPGINTGGTSSYPIGN